MRSVGLLLVAALCFATEGSAVPSEDIAASTNRDSPFEVSPDRVIDAMLLMGEVGPGSRVLDLGSGDGRLVLAAARHGARAAVGVEADLDLVRQSRRAAKKQREASKAAAAAADSPSISFIHGDIFLLASTPTGLDALRAATVVCLYLVPSAMALLEPMLFRHLLPGTVVVAHDYPFTEHSHTALWSAEDVPEKQRINGETSAFVYKYVVRVNTTGGAAAGTATPGDDGQQSLLAVGSAVLPLAVVFPGRHSYAASTPFRTANGRFTGILHVVSDNGRLSRAVLQGAADPRAPPMQYAVHNHASNATIKRGTTLQTSGSGAAGKRDAIVLPTLPLPIVLRVGFATLSASEVDEL
jgi:SAM-dependent methyltransferase